MSKVYEIYTYGGGEALTELFNGIVSIVGDNSYITLIKLAGSVGLAWMLLIIAFKPNNFTEMGKWFVGFVLLYNALLVPKVNIAIVDRINPGLERSIIENVPWGLGFFAHMASHIGDGTTRLIERGFTLPGDLKYSKHGTVMASSLVARASEFRITDPDLAANIRNFMQQCVFYDLLLGKYTLKEIFEASNTWNFVKGYASPARSFRYNQTIETCKDGSAPLERDWQQEIKRAAKIYGQRFFPSQADPQKALMSALPASYQYLTMISEDAGALLRQNMMMNALKDGIISNGAVVDASAAIQNFAVSRAEQQQRTAYAITGELAGRWLPIMKNVFESLFYGAFPFIFLVILLPAGIGVFKTYLMSLFWIQSWAPLYAILNLLMNIDAKAKSMAAAATDGGQAISLATASGIAQINSDTAILAGYLSMAIPFIAFGIIKGGAYTFTHLAGYIGGVSQASATQASEEATTGNISLANTSMSNHNFNNMSAHKQDLNADARAGVFSQQTASGATITSTAGGLQSISSGAAMSNIGPQIQVSESIRAQASNQYETYQQRAESQAQEYVNATTNAYRDYYELGKHQSQFTSESQSHGVGESALTANDFTKNQQLVDTFAKNNGISSELGASVIGSALARVGTPEFFSNYLPASFKASAELQGMSHARQTELMNQAQDFVTTHNMSEKFEHLQRASADENFSTGTEAGDRIIENTSASLDSANTARESATQNYQKAVAFKSVLSEVDERGYSINANASQEGVDWLAKQPDEYGNPHMGVARAEEMLHFEPERAREMLSQYVAEKSEQFIEQHLENQGFTDNVNSSLNLNSDARLNEQYQEDKQTLQQQAAASNLSMEKAIDNSVQAESQEMLQNTQQKITDSAEVHLQQGSKRQEAVDNALNEQAGDLTVTAVSNAADNVKGWAEKLVGR